MIGDLTKSERGPVAWMVRHRVAPNVLMIMLIIGGLLSALQVKQEVFPAFDLDMVTVRVPYPGASPAEVEQGIVLVVEENIRGIAGVKEVRSVAGEGIGTINAELEEGVDQQRVFQDIKQEVDRVRTFPDEAEEPVVSLATVLRSVMRVQVFGNVDDWTLRECAEQVRDRLLQSKDVSQVELQGARDLEVVIEIGQAMLRHYGLTLQQVADAIRRSSVEVPSGALDTEAGEILVRVKQRKLWAEEFAEIPVITSNDGVTVTVGQLGSVRDGFEDSDDWAVYNGVPAISLSVSRVGDQTPITVSDAVRTAMAEIGEDLPAGVDYAISSDRSEIFKQRADLMTKNATVGLVLVLLVLGLFLEVKLAFWVTMGIPIAFLGSFLVLPGWDVSINMISMFAFIIALGIVVDDAIIAGENIYEYRQRGMGITQAAIKGAQDVVVPITFAVLTNIVAFMPLLMVPGRMGKIFLNIPAVVISVFILSWLESLFVLPAHLSHSDAGKHGGLAGWIHRRQQRLSDLIRRLISTVYGPFLTTVLRYRYITVAAALVILAVTISWVASGRMGLIPMPRVESDRAVATVTLPVGSPPALATVVRQQLEAAAGRVADDNGGENLVEGYLTKVKANEVETSIYLTDPDIRPISTGAFTKAWRKHTGVIIDSESIRFEADRGGPGAGAALSIELSHRDITVLDAAGERLAALIGEYKEVSDINDGFTPGKRQFDLQLTAVGQAMGFTGQSLARQVRDAYFGAEALKQQRGRNEVTVRLRRPEAERGSEADIEQLLVRSPAGVEVPLLEVAIITRGFAYTQIERRNGRRIIEVTGDVEPIGETSRIVASIEANILPQLRADFPGLTAGFEGKQADFRDSMFSLLLGFIFALSAIYVLLAIPFRSYVQPLIVMGAIPFGIVGAIIGHLIMGYNLSIISMMGLLALSGVVVNDSLVLISYANKRRDEGVPLIQAVHEAGVRRFRPILLTTLTTFAGLGPMIFETSRQARFIIPMALSLGYGIVFATAIILLLIPCLYVVIEDIMALFGASARRSLAESDDDAAAAASSS